MSLEVEHYAFYDIVTFIWRPNMQALLVDCVKVTRDLRTSHRDKFKLLL